MKRVEILIGYIKAIMKKTYFWLVLLLLNIPLGYGAFPDDPPDFPLPAHAHNDYYHERPLLDALEKGFRSIEADVYSKGDSLYVAHNRNEIEPGRTLRGLYMNPIRKLIHTNSGFPYDTTSPLILLVDIKDNGLDTYKLLDAILQEYSEFLCTSSTGGLEKRSVQVVVSGNRPIDYMLEQEKRYAFVDGRIKDLEKDYSATLMPLISDRWTSLFSWKGKGEIPGKELIRLKQYVQQAHQNGQLIRFWATPDAPGPEREAIWKVLMEVGVDLINTDDLEGLSEFLKRKS